MTSRVAATRDSTFRAREVTVAFNQGMLEEIVDWCRASPELETTRREARSHFFGDEDERPVEYWPGTGNLVSKERRFLGYFLFNWELPSGEHVGESAVRRLYQGDVQGSAIRVRLRDRYRRAQRLPGAREGAL